MALLVVDDCRAAAAEKAVAAGGGCCGCVVCHFGVVFVLGVYLRKW